MISTIYRFWTIGDPHLTERTDTDQYARLAKICNHLKNNPSTYDSAVFLGDIVDYSNMDSTFTNAKSLLDLVPATKKIIVAGNHDVQSSSCKGLSATNSPCRGSNVTCRFKTYFGVYPAQKKVSTKAVDGITHNIQIIIPGICVFSTTYGDMIRGYFNWEDVGLNKTNPTYIFNHGPLIGPPSGCLCIDGITKCNWGDYFGYGKCLLGDALKFNLFAIYTGHVHKYTIQYISNNIRIPHITEGALISKPDTIGGCRNTVATDYIGYSTLQYNSVSRKYIHSYRRVNYSTW